MKYGFPKLKTFVKKLGGQAKSEIKLFAKATFVGSAGAASLYGARELVKEKFPEKKYLINTLSEIGLSLGIYNYGYRTNFGVSVNKDGELLEQKNYSLNEKKELVLESSFISGKGYRSGESKDRASYEVSEKPAYLPNEGTNNVLSKTLRLLGTGAISSAFLAPVAKVYLRFFTRQKTKIFNLPFVAIMFMHPVIFVRPVEVLQYFTWKKKYSVTRIGEDGKTQKVDLQGGETFLEYVYKNYKHMLSYRSSETDLLFGKSADSDFLYQGRHPRRFEILGFGEIFDGEYNYEISMDRRGRTEEEAFRDYMKEKERKHEKKALINSQENPVAEDEEKDLVEEVKSSKEISPEASYSLPAGFDKTGKNTAVRV